MRYPITSRFDSFESFRGYKHNGVDFAMPKDTPLRSIQNGIVKKIIDYGENVNAGKTILH